MDTRSQGFLDFQVLHFVQLLVEGLESWPLFSAEDKDESWEIERGVEANILVVAGLTRINIEIDDLLVDLRDVFALFKSGNKWTNILKGGTSHKFGGFILQEPVVDVRKFVGLIVDG